MTCRKASKLSAADAVPYRALREAALPTAMRLPVAAAGDVRADDVTRMAPGVVTCAAAILEVTAPEEARLSGCSLPSGVCTASEETRYCTGAPLVLDPADVRIA